MIAAPVQGDVDGIPKGSHRVRVPDWVGATRCRCPRLRGHESELVPAARFVVVRTNAAMCWATATGCSCCRPCPDCGKVEQLDRRQLSVERVPSSPQEARCHGRRPRAGSESSWSSTSPRTASAGRIGLRGPVPRNGTTKSTGTDGLRSTVRCAIRSCERLAACRLREYLRQAFEPTDLGVALPKSAEPPMATGDLTLQSGRP